MQSKIRKHKVEGVATLLGKDGQIHHKIMLRTRSRGHRTEKWVDVSNGSHQIGDVVKARRNPVFTIIEEAAGGEDTNEQHCPE